MDGYGVNQNTHEQSLSGLIVKEKQKHKAYINPQLVNCGYIKRTISNNFVPVASKIHVNPNFKGLSILNKKENPLLKGANKPQDCSNSKNESGSSYLNSSSQINVAHKNRFIWKKSNTINVYKVNESLAPKISILPKNSTPIYKSKTKIINKCKTKLINTTNANSKPIKTPVRPQSNNRFVYNKSVKSPSVKIASLVRNKYKYFNSPIRLSRYKIDKRKKLIKQKIKTLSKIQDIGKLFPKYNKPFFNNSIKNHFYKNSSENIHTWRRGEKSKAIGRLINHNKKVVKIGGILYKSTTNKLTLANKNQSDTKKLITPTKAKKCHVVYVRGEKFILGKNGKTLKKQSENKEKTPKRIDIGGVTYIQKSKNVLVRTNVHQARYLVKKAKHKSIALLTNLYKRSTMPCMIYHKFGKCMRHSKGLCMYKHDRKNIILCKRFLRGNCEDKKCLLSHEVIQEKMPTCHFFLNGNCVRENCPYLHVKLSKNAEICQKFLQGFCDAGKNCSKRHLHQCPEFDKLGTCSQGLKCPYPHKAKTSSTKRKKPNENLPSEEQPSFSKKQGKKKKTKGRSPLKVERDIKKEKKGKKCKRKSFDVADQSNELIQCFPKRIKLDKLPCFIPLKSDS